MNILERFVSFDVKNIEMISGNARQMKMFSMYINFVLPRVSIWDIKRQGRG